MILAHDLKNIEKIQELIAINLAHLFLTSNQFLNISKNTKLCELYDVIVIGFDDTFRELLSLMVASFVLFEKNDELFYPPSVSLMNIIELHKDENLFLETMKPFANMSIEAVVIDGSTSLQYYLNKKQSS